jgi:hypothetical protein
MSKPPLDWHPATWPWPPNKVPGKSYLRVNELGAKAREVLSRDGKFHRNIDDDIICRMVTVEHVTITRWWKFNRIDVVTNGETNELILSFDREGLREGEQGTSTEINLALKALKKHMVLDDLASV